MEYLLKVTNTYRVPNEDAALELRERLANEPCGRLTTFTHTLKEIKEKGECVEEYWVCKATIEMTKEKECDRKITVSYEEVG